MIGCSSKVKDVTYSQAITISWLLILFCSNLYSQNLVLNPSFEKVSSCPDDFFQINKSVNWFSPYCESFTIRGNGQATFFTGVFPCNNALTGVPINTLTNQSAHSGSSYAGILIVNPKIVYTEFRHYLETKLQYPLQAGSKYYFSMYYNLALGDYYTPSLHNICFRTDSLGVYFSNDLINNNPDCEPLSLQPQINAESKQQVPDGIWHEVSGCYTATGSEEYLTLGNFGHNRSSICTTADTMGYYLLIDDVTLIPSVSKKTDTVLCNGKNWQVDAQTFRNEYTYLPGWQYKWSDGDTGRVKKLTAPGNFTLIISNKDCFEDVYHFAIDYGDCNCKNYIATAFTPNGDNINDAFRPEIICKSGQISGYSFSIFNRWGQKLFSTASANTAWDGKYSGKKVSSGAYIYVIQYKTGSSSKVITVKGSVLVLDQ
ncbi:MAG: gliding motility-associated C-terminal domain-containing protein [Bacteroidota bacterium]